MVTEKLIEDRLLTLDKQRFEAMVDRDIETLDRMFHDDLLWTHASASVDGKQSFLERVRAGGAQYLEIVRDQARARVFGDAAIVSGVAAMRVVVNGVEKSVCNRYSNVWVKGADQWSMVHWQSTTMVSEPALFQSRQTTEKVSDESPLREPDRGQSFGNHQGS
jgi:ketosteroid isomerase-like protein